MRCFQRNSEEGFFKELEKRLSKDLKKEFFKDSAHPVLYSRMADKVYILLIFCLSCQQNPEVWFADGKSPTQKTGRLFLTNNTQEKNHTYQHV